MRWQIAQGSRRVVLVPQDSKVVLKIACFRRRYFHDYWRGNVVGMYHEMYASQNPEARKLYWENLWLGLKRVSHQTFGGIAENWHEWTYYLFCGPGPRRLLKPTYFSLLGLVNIQKRGIPARDAKVCTPARKAIGPEVVLDGHHWDLPYNFDVSSGRLEMLDYGSPQTRKILAKHWTALLELTFP